MAEPINPSYGNEKSCQSFLFRFSKSNSKNEAWPSAFAAPVPQICQFNCKCFNQCGFWWDSPTSHILRSKFTHHRPANAGRASSHHEEKNRGYPPPPITYHTQSQSRMYAFYNSSHLHLQRTNIAAVAEYVFIGVTSYLREYKCVVACVYMNREHHYSKLMQLNWNRISKSKWNAEVFFLSLFIYYNYYYIGICLLILY